MTIYVEIECAFCKTKYQKKNSIHKQSLLKQAREFCSMSCASKKKVKDNKESGISKIGTRSNEFTPFTSYLRHVRERIKYKKTLI